MDDGSANDPPLADPALGAAIVALLLGGLGSTRVVDDGTPVAAGVAATYQTVPPTVATTTTVPPTTTAPTTVPPTVPPTAPPTTKAKAPVHGPGYVAGDGFTIDLQGAYQQQDQPLSIGGTTTTEHVYVAVQGTAGIGFGYADLNLPLEGRAASSVLLGAVNGGITNGGGTVKTYKPTTYEGHPAADGVGEGKNRLDIRVVVVGSRLYFLLGFGTAGATKPPPGYRAMLTSFHLAA